LQIFSFLFSPFLFKDFLRKSFLISLQLSFQNIQVSFMAIKEIIFIVQFFRFCPRVVRFLTLYFAIKPFLIVMGGIVFAIIKMKLREV